MVNTRFPFASPSSSALAHELLWGFQKWISKIRFSYSSVEERGKFPSVLALRELLRHRCVLLDETGDTGLQSLRGRGIAKVIGQKQPQREIAAGLHAGRAD